VAVDSGTGAPPGGIGSSPYATNIPISTLEKQIQQGVGEGGSIRTDDPAFQVPRGPNGVISPTLKRDARIVYRDLPLVSTLTTWTVEQMRHAIWAHMWGVFDASGQLVDSILGDDRVMATLGSRISNLFGREVIFEPANDSSAARECRDSWANHWPKMATPAVMTELAAYSILMGFEPFQTPYDVSGPIWLPYIRPWHPRYTYYHWTLRKYVALSLDGPLAILPGNGKWGLHAPYGEYRGWIRGAIRGVATPWLGRHWALRDWLRFSEVHGIPVRRLYVPAASDEVQRDQACNAVSRIGSETTVMLAKGVDGVNSYDLDLLEATDTAWESFPGLRDHCDMAIVLAIMFQNLTTEVKGGSFAATSAHMDVRDDSAAYDNEEWKNTIYNQIARPFAFLNYGDPELAPITRWDVQKRGEWEANAKQFQQFGTAIEVLRRGGVQFKDEEELRQFAADRFGLRRLPAFKMVEPVAGGGMGSSK
jgi:phage gp29-like protein